MARKRKRYSTQRVVPKRRRRRRRRRRRQRGGTALPLGPLQQRLLRGIARKL